MQLCTLPWLGYVPDYVAAAPAVVVARLSESLGIPVGALRGYGAREQTRTGHLREVAAYLGWHSLDEPRWKDLEEFLFARAMKHDSPKLLFRLACEYLSSSRLGPAARGEHPGARCSCAGAGTEGDLGALPPTVTCVLCAELDGMLAR